MVGENIGVELIQAIKLGCGLVEGQECSSSQDKTTTLHEENVYADLGGSDLLSSSYATWSPRYVYATSESQEQEAVEAGYGQKENVG